MHGIVGFAHANNAFGIADIGRSELCWAASRRLWKVRTVLRVKSADGGRGYPSDSRDFVCRSARIQQSNNANFLSSGNSTHDVVGGIEHLDTLYLYYSMT